MEIFLVVLAVICVIIAIIGSIVPALPGPVLAYAALLIASASDHIEFSSTFLWVMAAVTAIVFALDYYLPMWIAKKMGGSKSAQNGALIGTLVGAFLTPIGMLIGMLIGAFVGEFMFNNSDTQKSIIAAIGAFFGFLAGTGIKLILCFYVLYAICVQIWGAIFN